MCLREVRVILGESTFQNLEHDSVLDAREAAPFDEEWVRVYRKIENLEFEPTSDSLTNLREAAFKECFKHTGNPELAAMVSDDFGLIGKSILTNYQDPWLSGVLAVYLEGKFPSGKIELNDASAALQLEKLAEEL